MAIRVRILGVAVNFDVADPYIKVPSGGNRSFLYPVNVLNVLYSHQPLSCAVVT